MNGWKTARIGEVVEPATTWNPLDQPALLFDYIDLSAIDQDSKRIVEARSLRGSEAPSRARQLVSKGDVLVSTVRPNLNGVAVVPPGLDGATASTGFCVLRTRPQLLDRSYLFHWVKSPQFVSDMTRRATGASYPAVSDRIIFESTLPLPPLDEQRRIAEILEAAEALRAKRRAAFAQLNTFCDSLFLDLFGKPETNEHCWPIVTVGQAGRVQLGRQRAPQYQSGKYTRHYMRVANVYEDRIELGDVLSMDFDGEDFEVYRLTYGDILLNEGQSTELVGRPAMWRDEIPECCFQNTLVRFQPDPKSTVAEFALAVFLRYFRCGWFAKVSSKTSNVAHLGAGRFAAMSFPLPPLALQVEFAHRFRAVEKLKALHSASLVELDALFTNLQHRAFRGSL